MDDGDWKDYSSATSVTLGGADGLPDGEHTFRVRANDAAGNVDGSPAESDFTIDATKPPVTATPSREPNLAGWHKANVSVTLEAGDCEGSDVASISYKINDAETATTGDGATVSVEVTDEGTITYHATDGAGNDGDQQTFTVKLDKTDPVISVTDPTEGATYDFEQAVEADYSCDEGQSG